MASTYFADSRAPRYSVLFAVPLLLAYEASAWFLADPGGGGVRNGADVILKSLFLTVGGPRGLLVFDILLAGIGTWLVVRDLRAHPGGLRASVFAGMLAESAVLAMLVGVVIGRATSALLRYLVIGPTGGLDLPSQLMISLGAGIYEELLFRVIVVGTLAAIGRRVFHWTPRTAGVVACVLGALLFSAFHYIGPYGDKLEAGSFIFRALAGLTFSALYLLRGFGITAWTHALYDIFVTLG
ncbi:MAG: CPBP family intramembrane glutamic endopeptidase [Gemmatimonadota bacterium]